VNRGRVGLAAAAGVLAAGGAAVAVLTGGPGAGSATSLRLGTPPTAVRSYWNPARIAGATALGHKAQGLLGAPAGYPAGMPFHGNPALGALLLHDRTGDHYCTASVIDSPKRNLLITAAHCIHGGQNGGYFSQVAFMPGYDAKNLPYGLWTAKLLVVAWGWTHNSDPDLDFGFIAVDPLNGHQIADVVGHDTLARDQGFVNRVFVGGYPDVRYEPGDHPISCSNTTSRQARYQTRFDCDGYPNGTSGSPWLLHYDPVSRTGQVIGVLGGYQQGGNTPWTSYAAYFDKDVWNLRASADRQA
jgi:V8-like Glu-specific endopeptidase